MNDRIISAQVSNLYSSLPISQFVTIVNSILLYGIQHPHVDESTAFYWLCTLLAVVFLRLSLYFLYRYPQQEYLERDNQIWRNIFFYTTIISAIIWGASGIFLFPEDNVRHQVFLVFVIAGMASGSIATLFAHKNSASLFLIIFMTPIIIQFMILPEPISKVMGFMVFVSLGSLLILTKHINHRFIENITLTVEAKLKETELLQYSSLLMQTQKLANIGGWDADLEKNQVKLSPEFNTIFSHIIESKHVITEAILENSKKSHAFDFELGLTLADHSRKHWVRIIGGMIANNPNIWHGAIQDISASKSVQLELDQSRKEVLKFTQHLATNVNRANKTPSPVSNTTERT